MPILGNRSKHQKLKNEGYRFARVADVGGPNTAQMRRGSALSQGRRWIPRPSPKLQRRQREQGKHQRENPEARDDFAFTPTQELEVMVQRGHLEDALAVS